jgi:curved DNA-binding protein CbpA
MRQDYFAILGLGPQPHDPAVVEAHYALARQHLRRRLADPAACRDALRELDQAHLAYNVLRDTGRQAAYLEVLRRGDPGETLRGMVFDALEDGLLRHSRRQEILAAGRELGFSEFHVHLLIAQAQFEGDTRSIPSRSRLDAPRAPFSARASQSARPARRRAAARLAAAGMLAAALFVLLVRFVGP